MNKFEKIKGDSVNELEEITETQVEENDDKKERKFFSLFTFWKKKENESPEEDAIVDFETAPEKKGIAKYLNVRTGALVASVAIIAVAGYINIRYASAPDVDDNDGIKASVEDINAALLEKDGEESMNSESDDYFALSVINRQRVRDEAMEILLDLTNSESTDTAAKADAYNEMTRMANEITSEANIESLVKAKGFNNCVAVVSNDDVNVVVESDGLTINEVAQIKEIVYLECGVHPDNVKIIEKAGV